MNKADRIEEIIASETEEYHKRVWSRCKPIVQREFDRLHKKYPSFRKIYFGNGTFLFDTEENMYLAEVPKDYRLLWDICNELVPFAQKDIVPTDEE